MAMLAQHDRQSEQEQDSAGKIPDRVSLDLTPYAGRWVALIRGRVVAAGETAQEALLAARYQCTKDEPSLIWVPLENFKATKK